MTPARACPICPECGSKKFERLESDGVKVQCTNCKKINIEAPLPEDFVNALNYLKTRN